MAVPTNAASPVRKKQYMILGGLTLVIVVVALVVGSIGAPPAKQSGSSLPVVETRKQFGAQAERPDSKDVWRTVEGARVSQLQLDLEDMKKKMQNAEQSRVMQDDAAKAQAAKDAAEAKKMPPMVMPATALPPQPPRSIGQPPVNSMGRTADQLGSPAGNMDGNDGAERVRGIVKIDISKDAGTDSSSKGSGAVKAAAQRTVDNYIPSGTFLRGITLSGMDAPTGGQSQQNPVPIVIRVTDLAQLPNRFRSDLKECFVVGNGTGDISSETAFIRLDRLSCVSESGKNIIDIDVKGYVTDESGKAGIRGRLVSKQGQLLANSLLAGVASGIGTAFVQSNTTQSISPLGTTSTMQAGKELQSGVGTGVGKALDQLAKYYITLAEKIFPVIEVDAARQVDIVITRGMSLEGH